jgi:NADH-ubiquinone oxidoreductase chain 4
MVVWLAFFAAFATKIPIFPLYIWLPEAHVEATTSGSIILAALLLKIGTYGLIRFSLTIMPVASLLFTPLIMTGGLLAIVFTSFTSTRQLDLKKLLAYVSIVHMNALIIGLLSSNLTAAAAPFSQDADVVKGNSGRASSITIAPNKARIPVHFTSVDLNIA